MNTEQADAIIDALEEWLDAREAKQNIYARNPESPHPVYNEAVKEARSRLFVALMEAK